MDEKTMCNDVLSCSKANLTRYENAIVECENVNLRQTIQQIRDDEESFKYELYKIAKSKGYYKPADPADISEVQKLKNELSNC